MQQALEALEQVAEYFNVDSTEAKAIASLRERLAQPDPVLYWHSEFLKHNTTSEQPAQQQEPVWIQPNHLQKARQAPFLCRVEPKQRDDFVPLYTTLPQRKPLTVEQIAELDCNDHYKFAQAIEAAHGITGEQK